MVNLVELHGEKIPDEILFDPTGLSNRDAGVLFLTYINKKADEARLAGCKWYDLVCKAKEGGEYLASKTKAVLDYTGEKIGEGVRLLTDEEVRAGIKEYGAAYATGGKSITLESALNNMTGGQGQGFLEMIGSIFKGTPGQGVNKASLGEFNVSPQTLIMGLGLVVSSLILIKIVSR